MTIRFVMLSAFLLLAIAGGPLSAQETSNAPAINFNGLELTIGGRVHTQFNTTSIDDLPPSQLFIRRARIELSMRLNDYISGAIQPDFAGDRVQLKDVYMTLALSPAFEIRAGNAYRPFSLLQLTSSKRMPVIERGVRIRGLDAADEFDLIAGLNYADRDIGVQVLGAPEEAPLDLTYAAGVFRGPLHGLVGDQDSYQFAARMTASPIDDVRIGLGWSSRDFALANLPNPDLERGHAFEVDLEYGSFSPGAHFLGEVALGDLDPFRSATFWGAQGWLAYRTEPLTGALTAVEPNFRVSYAETEADDFGPIVPGGTLLTPGINLYFGGLNRFMMDYDIWLGSDDSIDAQSFKAMFLLGF